MSQHGSLLHARLQGAQLRGSDDAEEFWGARLTNGESLRQAYFRYREDVPLDSGIVFYETMSGDRMNDNPYAIFKYLRAHPEYGTFLHVWSLGEHGTVPEEYAGLDDVVFAPRGTLAYVYFLACAERIVCNAVLPEFFTRRDGQSYLNTWHGIPYKALGRKAARARFGSATGLGTFLKATHVLTPCEFMTDALLDSYSMAGASTARIAETGYPRVDLTVNSGPDDVARLRHGLGIKSRESTDSLRPVVLYAPTWRSSAEGDTVDLDQLLRDLEILAKLDIHLVYRGHHRIGRLVQDRAIGAQIGHVIIPPQEMSSNELLAAVDVLITDYSSIFFDFLPTGRPIIHYLYDLDHYAKSRGLNLGVDELPGEVARNVDELVGAVNRAAEALRGVDPRLDLARSPLQGEPYRAAQVRFAPHEDGLASKRAVEFFLLDGTAGVPVRESRDGRGTVAFWAGCLTDDAQSDEFLQDAIAFSRSSRYQVSLIIDRASRINRDTLKVIRGRGNRLSCIAYDAETPTLRPSEAKAYSDFISSEPRRHGPVWRILRGNSELRGMFSREYRRRLDDAHFDALFLAPGLTPYELGMAAFACHKNFTLGRARAFRSSLTPPLRRAASAILPRGTARRALAERAHRRLGGH